ncbi:Spo0E family sporulation regulatory protein-aspartic acid phosphatase [Metabacillus endolithicus]|uniref:Spo0E family sporulation regulatory protein-aspartic acid phosphatase n=1 Tax=Metabacillus endolithicus TaxID=1535204 RepID=UPI00367251F2
MVQGIHTSINNEKGLTNMDHEELKLNLIEPTRNLMYKVINEHGINSEQALRLSKIIDELVNIYLENQLSHNENPNDTFYK